MKRGPIRLACLHCDRTDCDGITVEELAWAAGLGGWQHVAEHEPSESVVEWWTHLGWCPECVKEEAMK